MPEGFYYSCLLACHVSWREDQHVKVKNNISLSGINGIFKENPTEINPPQTEERHDTSSSVSVKDIKYWQRASTRITHWADFHQRSISGKMSDLWPRFFSLSLFWARPQSDTLTMGHFFFFFPTNFLSAECRGPSGTAGANEASVMMLHRRSRRHHWHCRLCVVHDDDHSLRLSFTIKWAMHKQRGLRRKRLAGVSAICLYALARDCAFIFAAFHYIDVANLPSH